MMTSSRRSKLEFPKLWVFYCLLFLLPVLLLVAAYCLLPTAHLPSVNAQETVEIRGPAFGFLEASPTIAITTGTATTAAMATTGATTAHVQFAFGTIAGSFTGCTVQAKTSFDGVNFLTLGSAATLTTPLTSSLVNAWDIYQQAPVTTGVTVTTPSSSAAAGFGAITEYTFACSGYGTAAPVTVTAIYK